MVSERERVEELAKNEEFVLWLIEEDEGLPWEIYQTFGINGLEDEYARWLNKVRRDRLGADETPQARPLTKEQQEFLESKRKAEAYNEEIRRNREVPREKTLYIPPERCPSIPVFESEEAERRHAMARFNLPSRLAMPKWEAWKRQEQEKYTKARELSIESQQRFLENRTKVRGELAAIKQEMIDEGIVLHSFNDAFDC